MDALQNAHAAVTQPITGERYVPVIWWLIEEQCAHPSEAVSLATLQRQFPSHPSSVLAALHAYCTHCDISQTIFPKASPFSSSGIASAPDRPSFSNRPWSGIEIATLMKALERFPDQWDRVAHEVGTRTAQECLVYFLSLPLFDEFGSHLFEQVRPPSHATADAPATDEQLASSMSFLSILADPKLYDVAARALLQESKACQTMSHDSNGAIRPNAGQSNAQCNEENAVTRAAAAVALAVETHAANKRVSITADSISKWAKQSMYLQLAEVKTKAAFLARMTAELSLERHEVQVQENYLRRILLSQRRQELGLTDDTMDVP